MNINKKNSIIELLEDILDITKFPKLMQYSKEQTKIYDETVNHVISVLEEILL